MSLNRIGNLDNWGFNPGSDGNQLFYFSRNWATGVDGSAFHMSTSIDLVDGNRFPVFLNYYPSEGESFP